MAYPPGVDHETLVICNGGPPSQQIRTILFGLPHIQFFPRNNAGWDIGGYVDASKGPALGADMILCLGETVHFHRAGWLKRLVEAWETHGEGMYGVFASNVIRAHLNTTAFATAPKFLAQYPVEVVTRKQRYEFEHGAWGFWRLLSREAKPTLLVTWDGVWKPHEWRRPANILWRGDQSNCLMWCNHNETFRDAKPQLKAYWQRWADAPFA
jgi:hypothetical protein